MAKVIRFPDSNQYPTHLNWKTRWNAPVFGDAELAIECLQAIEHERNRMGLDVLAYCLMPDHFHLVVGPTLLKLGQIVQGLKLASTHRMLTDGLVIKTPWRRSYYDVGIRDGRQLRNTVEYLHNNPVKAGLIDIRTSYPLSSSGDWEMGQQGLIVVAKHLWIPD